ncbi:hypothetical protein KAT24_01105 [Candidatus Pacearchaeota archaeon]|nr:hypothetical protein [Candidatus Pacearchaeota archaeon]
MIMQLENVMYEPMQRAVPEPRGRVYTIVDLESLSASALYTPKLPMIKPGFGQNVIPLGNLGIPELKDVHETFKIDRYENLYNGHTTFVPLKGPKKHFGY